MKTEEKQLLLKDLCARLPFKIKVKVSEVPYPVEFDVQMLAEIKNNNWYEYPIPYLRPMSSMTEEEKKKYKHLVAFSGSPNGAANFIDWLNKKMFAYRTIDGKDMFELGLALKAPEGMYEK